MTRHHNPLISHLSGRVARTVPVEQSPEFEAMMGDGIVRSTWGDYATKAMDMYDLEPGQALALLGITNDDIADSTTHFENYMEYENFSLGRKRRFYDEAKEEFGIEADRLCGVVDVVMSGYALPDMSAANEIADSIQEQISEADRSEEGYENQQTIRCMDRDAHASGVRVTLDEFVRVMLGATNVLDEEIGSEFKAQWVCAVNEAVEDIWRDYTHPEATLREMFAGKEIFMIMKSRLRSLISAQARQASEARWQLLEPIFTTGRIEDSPLFTGLEEK